MKAQTQIQALRLGELDLQVEFTFPRQKTRYRTITHPPSFAVRTKGNRACLNLTTNKAENLQCSKPVISV